METNNLFNLHKSRFKRFPLGVIGTTKDGYFKFNTFENGCRAALAVLQRMVLDKYTVSDCICRWPDCTLTPVEFDLFGLDKLNLFDHTYEFSFNSPLVPYTATCTFICRQLKCVPQDKMSSRFYKDFLLYLARIEQKHYDPRWEIDLDLAFFKFSEKL